MAYDLLFPGVVMILKLFFKLTIEQEVKMVDALKAIMLFPIDMAFLAFSFGAAILYRGAATKLQGDKAQIAFAFLLGCLLLATMVILICKKADRYFIANKFLSAFFCSFLGYLFSVIALFASLNTGAML